LRELEEETSISGEQVDVEGDFRFESCYLVRAKRSNFKEAEKTLVVFLGWLTNHVEIRPTEHQGFSWIAWSPPHAIQSRTIDPLLASIAVHFNGKV
jgi:hypothetical protein